VGVYLRGSLATGDFLATSDLDVLTVTERAVDDAELAALRALHDRPATLPGEFSSRFEAAYIDRAALRRFTSGQHHPTLYWNELLARSEHGANWILERSPRHPTRRGATSSSPDTRSNRRRCPRAAP
jgi:hypothetical protein